MLAPISGSRRDGKSSFRTLTRYLTESLNPETGKIMPRGEHVLSDSLLSYETAVPEMRSVAFQNPRVADPIFHYQLCWRPGEQPSREKWEEAARKTIRDLGFSEHQFLVVSHNDREHFHVHVLINRVHPETYRAHTPLFSKRELDKSLREIEHAQGWTQSPGLYRWDSQLGRAVKNSREDMEAQRARANVGRSAQKLEHFQDAESLEAYAKGAAKDVHDVILRGGRWQDLHTVLKISHGLEIEKAEQGGYTVRVIDSDIRVKASKVFRGDFSGKENRARTEKQLGEWQPPGLNRELPDSERTYQPKRDPAHRAERSAERAKQRDQLKGEYRGYRAGALKAVAEARKRGSVEFRKLATSQREERASVRARRISPLEKQIIRSEMAAAAVRDRAALKQKQLEERAKLKPKTYREWVIEQAQKCNAAAIGQVRGFMYQDRRRAGLGRHWEGEVSIQSGEGTDWREWSDTPDEEIARLRKLYGDLRTLKGAFDVRTGWITFQLNGKDALMDVGSRIALLNLNEANEATIVAGLELAVQKFGTRLEVHGNDSQKKEIALAAAKHGMNVEFADRTTQQFYQLAKDANARDFGR